MRGPPNCVVDTMVLVYANARQGRHVSQAQAARWSLLRAMGKGEVRPVKSERLLAEYLPHLKAGVRNEDVRAFVAALDLRGLSNWQPLRSGEIEEANACGFPHHDLHLLKTANGVERCTVACEEARHLGSAACVRRKLSIRIARPCDVPRR